MDKGRGGHHLCVERRLLVNPRANTRQWRSVHSIMGAVENGGENTFTRLGYEKNTELTSVVLGSITACLSIILGN